MNIKFEIPQQTKIIGIIIIALILFFISPIQKYKPADPETITIIKIDTVFEKVFVYGKAKVETIKVYNELEAKIKIAIDTTLLGIGDTFQFRMNIPEFEYWINYNLPELHLYKEKIIYKRDFKEYVCISSGCFFTGITALFLFQNWNTIYNFINP